MLSAFLPSKWVLLVMAALIVTCGYFYLSNRITRAELETATTELKQAVERVETQKATIELLQRDAKVQADLLRQAQSNMSAIRQQAALDIQTLTQRDLGAEANTDAAKLGIAINEQFHRLLDNIARNTR